MAGQVPARGKAPRREIISVAPVTKMDPQAVGGLDGAERLSRETALWAANMRSPDSTINPVKREADARGVDTAQNDGIAAGAINFTRDSIVGAEYRLNATPNWRVLGLSQEWAEEWSEIVEARFNTIAESQECWLDASGGMTFTDMIRLGVISFITTGEACMSSEWVTEDRLRPLRTAFQMISPDRLSNPNDDADTETLKRGVEKDRRGKPVAYHIRQQHPGEIFYAPSEKAYTWKRVRAATGWGRWQFLHVMEKRLPDQSRGIAAMVSVLKHMRMTRKFSDITLQNAVVNATYAAAIESELPSDAVVSSMGGGAQGFSEALAFYLNSLSSYLSDANNIALDGVKIPHLFPGTKFKLQPAGTPGGVGTDFESGLLRRIAAGLDMSYEELARDYRQTNYSSARASGVNTWRAMQTKKRAVADKIASAIYRNVLEEEISLGNIPLPRGKGRSWFYEPLVANALTRATWIGAARGQVDEMKETQSALERVKGNISTLEIECARVGLDWRDVIRQRAREKKAMSELGLDDIADAETSPRNNTRTPDDDDYERDR